MEITVISAQGLKNTSSSLFSRRLKPFVTLSLPPPPCQSNGYKPCHVYKTRVDDGGGVNPTWGDTFHIPIDHATFLCEKRPFVIYLQLYNSILTGGQAQLGWCQIPATDVVDGFFAVAGLCPPPELPATSERRFEGPWGGQCCSEAGGFGTSSNVPSKTTKLLSDTLARYGVRGSDGGWNSGNNVSRLSCKNSLQRY
ncbi:hypothetical protein Acr_15g0007530 [Actinidia rufa]|uniref:C2 domain-containing protein n=1 Tax=Actinidia rufa TaxID=165716 RepID=A0A7J0FU90_9ERIC|nr:hypothetical protein Acr_15g0007530 [Actinidia rufa]